LIKKRWSGAIGPKGPERREFSKWGEGWGLLKKVPFGTGGGEIKGVKLTLVGALEVLERGSYGGAEVN